MRRLKTDPAHASKVLLGVQGVLASAMKMAGISPEENAPVMQSIVQEFLTDYKASVIEEMLETQKSTNEALAAATGRKE